MNVAYTMVLEGMDEDERDEFNESLWFTRAEYAADIKRKAEEEKAKRADNISRLGGVIKR